MLKEVVVIPLVFSCIYFSGCNQESEKNKISHSPAITPTTEIPSSTTATKPNYLLLQRKITQGIATLYEIRLALTNDDELVLTNTVHALYGMRWFRGAFNMVHDLWTLEKEKYPELAWNLIEKPPVRLAVAGTLNRLDPDNTDIYMEYIRSQTDTGNDFDKAQVAIALGFNKDLQDIEYLKSQAINGSPYLAQSAITGLALFNNESGRDALIEILNNDPGKTKGDLILNVLKEVYEWTPNQIKQEKDLPELSSDSRG